MPQLRSCIAVGLLGLATAWALPAAAQVYRIVGPDGKVTFSDKPPQDAKAKSSTMATGGGSSVNTAGLPFELQDAAKRFPVTLYTGSNCDPCGSARSMLMGRGIPFAERTVTSNDDIDAFTKLIGSSPSVPLLTIGGQQLKGFSDSEWNQYLDAAGYPKTSQLPPGYRNPPASPLVAVQVREAGAAPAPGAPTRPAPAAARTSDGPTGDNPAGIKF